jgi:hypothetical protein
MKRYLAATALLVACALPASAQTTYAAPSGDTLRFREVLQGKVAVTTPQGEIPVTIEFRSTIGVVRMRGDSARAWYDSLSMVASSPAGEQRPAADSALKQPFRLAFDSRGRVRLVQAPKFPSSFQGLTDLSQQFNDYFLRLPEKPLVVGLAWSDSSVRRDSTADRTSRWATVAEYRVERDTVVDGVPAVIVAMKQRITVNGDGPVPNQPMRATSVIEGGDEGFFVFAPRAGRLLARRRTGKLEGDTFLRGGGQEIAMRQSYTYTSTLDAVR